ncbi:DUF262 domain-containing protein [Psychrobacter sp. HY3-MNA-CIBAN-0198]|uniref:DUF262 domain-containing protein n=1 Tax=Psychrobacter sp. HY3-MNA-CIBAN-0198 TaxID=3140441 RepID=UPI003326D40A
MSKALELNQDEIEYEKLVEDEIKKNQKEFDFDIKEYPLEFLMTKFNPDENEFSEIYIPDYQREFIWTDKQQSLFIESLLIGLPIPYIFVADIDDSEKEESDGRLEVVDGSQRLRTLYRFSNNKLKLIRLERLLALEGKTFSELPLSRQRRFMRTSIRMIELTQIDEEGRRTMFDRLNTGGTLLTEMEKRRGTQDSPFLDLITTLSKDKKFKKLVPLSKAKVNHKDDQELILRFFAYRYNYENFKKQVRVFLDEFIEDNKNLDKISEDVFKKDFENMLNFVENNFKFGFRKSKNAQSVPRVRFEAISAGVSLAINEQPILLSKSDLDTSWALSPEFHIQVTSDGSNSKPKVFERIEYVKNKILEAV